MNRKAATLFVAAAMCAAMAFAEDEDKSRFELRFARDLPYRGGKITVDHKFGSVNIRPGERGEVDVRAVIRSSDPDFGKQVRIETEAGAGGVKVTTVYPSGRWSRNRDFSYSVDYEILVPPSAPVEVSNRFGSVTARGIGAGSEIVNGHGSIRLSDAQGSQKLENQFGSIDVSDIGGDVTVRNANGSIRADAIRGKVDLTNRFGSVVVSKSGGATSVRNSNGSVDVRDIGGPVVIDNSFGSIKVSEIRGNLKADGSHSKIDVRGIRGDADVSSAFGSIDVSDVQGSAKVTNANGTVKVSGVRRSAAVKTTFSSAIVKDVQGSIDVHNQNGAISVSGAPACQPITLRTSFSTIRVSVPSSASYEVSARTTFGKISSDLPITTSSLGGETTVGTIGGGKCKMELANTNGSITIKQE